MQTIQTVHWTVNMAVLYSSSTIADKTNRDICLQCITSKVIKCSKQLARYFSTEAVYLCTEFFRLFSILHTVFCFICFRISERWSSLFQLWNIICVLYRLKQSLNIAFFSFCFVCYTGTRFNTRVPWTYRFCSIYQAIHFNYNAVSIYGVFWWTFKVYNEFSSRLHSNKHTHTHARFTHFMLNAYSGYGIQWKSGE